MNELLKQALQLSPAERLHLIELITESLDKPVEKIEQIWNEEAEKRYEALVAQRIKTIPLNEVIHTRKAHH